MYETLAQLPIRIEGYMLDPHVLTVVGGMERHTTVVQLLGKGMVGEGEDVTYEAADQKNFQEVGASIDFTNVKNLGEFCDMVGALDLFPKAKPAQEASRRYRRWAFESAALDLALRQAGKSLAEVLNRQPKPVHFIVSQRLGKPSTIDLLQARLDQYPDLRFKLDYATDWTDELIQQLVETHAVDTLDLKGFYRGTPVDVETDPVLYQKLLNAFPNAWFEDPDVNDETRKILEPHADRITWDAPLHTAKDILHMPFRPKMINVKPSRFGSIQELSKVYKLCEKQGIGMYSGGQFELSVGRGQIQYLASLFHPDTPNDVSPIAYHQDQLPEAIPTTTLPPVLGRIGFF
jgi:L-alanine-DL-glutamate epimerase-like enolase superfamily enzyme